MLSDSILFPSDHFAITFKLTIVKQPAHKSGSSLTSVLLRETMRDFVNSHTIMTPCLHFYHKMLITGYIYGSYEEAMNIVMHEFIPVIN